MKSLIAVVVMLITTSTQAHQPEISSLTLIKQGSNQWTLQLSAPLTAFQYEVKNAFGNDSYTSVEEFNQMLLKHLKRNIFIESNRKEIALSNGMVKLGHATNVAFELLDMPEDLNHVFVKNKAFENIHHSQVIFSLYNDNLDSNRFVLTQTNDYQMFVSIEGNQVVMSDLSSNETDWILQIVIAIGIALLVVVIYNTNRRSNYSFDGSRTIKD